MRFRHIKLGISLLVVFSGTFHGMAQTPVTDHWSPYNYPREIPEGVPYHMIVDGDTLWDLSAQYLGDPLLWPQIYQINGYIQDPDLIYPGDPIFLNVGVVVDETSIAQNLGDEEGSAAEGDTSGEFTDLESFGETGEGGDPNDPSSAGDEEIGDPSQTSFFDEGASEFVILPAGDRSDMECTTYLFPLKSARSELPFDMLVSGGENKYLETHSTGDILYLNKGLNNGVQPGEIYSVRRRLRNVYHPVKQSQFLGAAIDQVGKIRIVAVQEVNATALVIYSCQDIRLGDFVVPFEQEPIPLITELPVANRWDVFSKEGSGYIVDSEEKLLSFGKGHVANINLGLDQNVAPGDIFIIYRDNPNTNLKKKILLPEIYIGHGVALKTSANSTVIKIIEGFTNITIGDKVVPLVSGAFSQ